MVEDQEEKGEGQQPVVIRQEHRYVEEHVEQVVEQQKLRQGQMVFVV